MNCDKIGNCDQCPKWFYEGKDFCKSCNFDLNSYNQPEEDDDCVECFDCEEVIDRDDSLMVPQSDNNAKLVCVCNSCNENRKFWDEKKDEDDDKIPGVTITPSQSAELTPRQIARIERIRAKRADAKK